MTSGVFTRKAVERIAHEAFALAMQRRKKVTIVHKANVLRLSTGLFLNVCREVAEQYPEVKVDDYHIDAMAAHLVRRAADFDVIVTENMYGDILSDLAGELVGSLGLAPSLNANEHMRYGTSSSWFCARYRRFEHSKPNRDYFFSSHATEMAG